MIALAIVIFLIFYLSTGWFLFDLGIKAIGGVDEYVEHLRSKGSVDPYALYKFAKFLFMFVWPHYLFRRDK